ncbi:MAG: TolC family protein [Bergeyella sp.]|nr:TolC family protein [Bergeyella sp.]
MSTLKKFVFILILSAFVHLSFAQISDTISLSRKEAEALFLDKNFEIILQRLEISQAEARVVQAKLWPNPSLGISEVNLWHSRGAEELPLLTKNWGKYTQISAEIEQAIQTAGKRRKNIELHKIEVEGKKYELQEVLRELKKSLRNTITEISYNQSQQKLYKNQISSIEKLTRSYKNQLKEGNISRAEYVRLKAQEIEFKKDLISLKQEMEEGQIELKLLLMLPSAIYIKVEDELEIPHGKITSLNLSKWIEMAKENRPDLLLSRNNEKYAMKNLELQKAMKTPDLGLVISYDRGGNIMRNFVGFGVSFDLPIFDRNKGNIQEAKIEVTKNAYETQKNILKTENEIVSAMQNFIKTEEIYHELDEKYESILDELLRSYEKNFRLRNISMVEYMDFLESYMSNKKIILDTKKELKHYYENLQYVVGQDI